MASPRSIQAFSTVSQGVSSLETGKELGEALARGMGEAPIGAVLVYGSIEHDQGALLAGVRQRLPGAPLVGCSTQGIMARGVTVEEGYFAGAMALGGELRAATARQEEINLAPREKGAALGDALRAGLGEEPKLVVLLFDPLVGADLDELLAGLGSRVSCPITGGAASQPWGKVYRTFQYFDGQVLSGGAVALGLSGAFAVEVAASHGTQPLGVEHTVTRAERNRVQELDGARATEVWAETTGSDPGIAQIAMLALGIPNERDEELGAYRVLAPMLFDTQAGTLVLAAKIETGRRIMLHYRTVDTVLSGTQAMGESLHERIADRPVRAVLGFECGARTEPFLGQEATEAENLALQELVAPDAPWFGMLCWGEVLPLQRGPVVVNYTFPVVCLLAA